MSDKNKIRKSAKPKKIIIPEGFTGVYDTSGDLVGTKELKRKDKKTFDNKRIKKQGPQPGPEDQEKHWENYPQRKLAGGGKATHGYGKAYMKGGRVK